MNEIIQRDDATSKVWFTPEATELREQALATSALIGKVTNAEDNAAAVEAQTALQRILTETEKARKVVKQPVIDMGRAIDDAAKQFTEEVGREIVRVSRLIGDFQALELAKQRAAERAKQAELDRIEREKAAALREIQRQEEEKRRQEQEKQRQTLLSIEAEKRRLAEIKSQEERAAAEEAMQRKEAELKAEFEKAKAIAQAESHDQLEAIHEHFNAVAAVTAEKPAGPPPVLAKGQKVEEEWEVTVTDIYLLAKVHPGLVKIEARISDIKAALDSGAKIAGIEAKKVVKAGVRLGRQRPVIDIN